GRGVGQRATEGGGNVFAQHGAELAVENFLGFETAAAALLGHDVAIQYAVADLLDADLLVGRTAGAGVGLTEDTLAGIVGVVDVREVTPGNLEPLRMRGERPRVVVKTSDEPRHTLDSRADDRAAQGAARVHPAKAGVGLGDTRG